MINGMSQNSFPFRTAIAKLLLVKIIVIIVVVALMNVLVISAALSAKFSNVWHSLGDAFLIS